MQDVIGLLNGGNKIRVSSSGSVHGGGGSHTFASPTVEISTVANKIIYPDTAVIPWMRYLYIEFVNSNGQVYGVGGYDDSLSIEVTVTKTLASVGDSASITIYNLPMVESMRLAQGNYTQNVRIYCGYYNTAKIKIFDGGVTYMEEGKSDRNTSILNINCANRLISDRLQSRLSLSLNTGYNLYRAIEEVAAGYGVTGQIEIDECLKEDTLIGALSEYETMRDWLNAIISSSSLNRNYAINTSKSGNIASVLGYRKMGSGDTYVINTRDVNLQAFPTISVEGLSIVLSPIYPMTPGDIISIDNTAQSLISMLNSQNSYIGNKIYVDKDGLYNIRQMTYDLSNRDNQFNVKVLAIGRYNLQQQMLGESD